MAVLGIDGHIAQVGSEVTVRALQELIANVTSIADQQEVTFLATDVDADAFKIILVAGVPVTSIDVDALTRELPKAFPEADMYAIREITYSIPLNTLNVDVGEVRLLWAPAGAPNGMTVLATLPPLPSRSNGNGAATINVGGETALSDYLANTSPRVLLFAETELDVDPGAAFPEGEHQVVAEVALTASGPVL